MLQAAISHRFVDGEVREAHFRAASLEEILDQIRDQLQEWDPTQDEATTIRIMTAEINGHA